MSTRAQDHAPATLTELLRASARRWPERVAVGDCASGGTLTYRQLEASEREPQERERRVLV
ncbi:hypothetical protein ACIGXM_34110 [Kitasatospora sp. NPDC052896]|uniref:hypothetical protein n=1 Tax=Kitasatospora sp. NPDC052896 TaxID=3364061 RepID=UPI0037C5FD58